MEVRRISRMRFEMLAELYPRTTTDEREWFASANSDSLGAIRCDAAASNWSIVVLKRGADNNFRKHAAVAGFGTRAGAFEELMRVLEGRER